MKKRIIIMGAAGRDFHNFNCCFRDNPDYEVIAFTAAQIPFIHNRIFPKELSGQLYPDGIPVYPEEDMIRLIREKNIDEVVFAYSDVSHEYVMHRASVINSLGAGFLLLSPDATMLKSNKPVISVCAVRTGCGKSGVTKRLCQILKTGGRKGVVIRHPMPYRDLLEQRVQRFASYYDLQKCTIEEREEYEPLIEIGVSVFAGVDYKALLSEAEKEAEIIVWDGGNNDTPFIKPDFEIVVLDPHRPGHELLYYPGEVNFRRADCLVINKMDTARKKDVQIVLNNIKAVNPDAIVIHAASQITIEDDNAVKNKSVLVVEDGPTLTHGGMSYGAGIIAARKHKAKKIVDPRPYAAGTIKETLNTYPSIKNFIPAVGYSSEQIKDLEDTINRIPCDVVVIATPVDLRKIIKISKRVVRVRYEVKEIGMPDLKEAMGKFLKPTLNLFTKGSG